MIDRLWIVYQYSTVDVRLLWSQILSCTVETEDDPDFRFYGKKMQLASLTSNLTQRKHFTVESERMKIHFGSVRNNGLDQVLIGSRETGVNWNRWMEKLKGVGALVSARVVSAEYDHWQNAQDLLLYEAAGRDHTALPKRSNGLPFPLERTVVDVSSNPGRFEFKEGYICAVGSPMWVGKSFWSLTGASKDEVTATPWINPEWSDENVVKICPWPEPFATTEGESGIVQKKLRALLFPRDATVEESRLLRGSSHFT